MADQKCTNSRLYERVWELFNNAHTARSVAGVTNNIQDACIRNNTISHNGVSVEIEDEEDQPLYKECGCSNEESCAICEEPDLRSIDEAESDYESNDALDDIGKLLASAKRNEFLALASTSYSGVSDRPFILEPDKSVEPTNDAINEAMTAFFDYIESFLEENQVKVTEIEDAFDVETLRDLANKLSESVDNELYDNLYKDIAKAEEIIRKIFRRSNVMQQYLECLRDITIYPIAVMWASRNSINKSPVMSKKGFACAIDIQSDAFRVDPKYAWFTNDWKHGKTGTATFRRELLTDDDLENFINSNKKIEKEIKCVLGEETKTRMPMLSLFDDEINSEKLHHDCLVMRGSIKRELVEEYANIKCKKHNVLVEVWTVGTNIVRVLELPEALEMGVYTTTFRRYDDSLYGYSLDNLIEPFIKFYESVIKGISKSAGKNTGSLVMIDNAVVDEWTQYVDIIDGVPVLDTSSDIVIEFDSNEAGSTNWRGVPLDIKKFPTDIPTLVPLLSLIQQQLEGITGIPSFLTQQSSLNSALRTEEMLNMVNEANSKNVKAMLDKHQNRILRKIIEWFFYTSSDNVKYSNLFMESSPRILMGSEIVTEFNSDRRLSSTVRNEIAPLLQAIAPDKLGEVLNQLFKDSYGYTENLIDTGGISRQRETGVAPASPAPSTV